MKTHFTFILYFRLSHVSESVHALFEINSHNQKKKPCFLIDFTMARLCFNPFRLHKSKNKSITSPSSSSRFHLNNENQNIMERKRFDSLDSWSMILDSENVETWEVSKEDREDWTADLSQLFVGNKFASGAHSRIYRGIYKQRAVAVKMVRIPTQKDETRALLEQQFNSEVALLSRLYHPNIVQVGFLISSACYVFDFMSYNLSQYIQS